MIVKQLTEHHLELLSFKGGCTGSSEYKIVKMPHCWKSHVTAHIVFNRQSSFSDSSAILHLFLFHARLAEFQDKMKSHNYT